QPEEEDAEHGKGDERLLAHEGGPPSVPGRGREADPLTPGRHARPRSGKTWRWVVYRAASHRPHGFPSGSMRTATAPTPGIGIRGSATEAPSSVALAIISSMLATST